MSAPAGDGESMTPTVSPRAGHVAVRERDRTSAQIRRFSPCSGWPRSIGVLIVGGAGQPGGRRTTATTATPGRAPTPTPSWRWHGCRPRSRARRTTCSASARPATPAVPRAVPGRSAAQRYARARCTLRLRDDHGRHPPPTGRLLTDVGTHPDLGARPRWQMSSGGTARAAVAGRDPAAQRPRCSTSPTAWACWPRRSRVRPPQRSAREPHVGRRRPDAPGGRSLPGLISCSAGGIRLLRRAFTLAAEADSTREREARWSDQIEAVMAWSVPRQGGRPPAAS